jgi:hypothetical protein
MLANLEIGHSFTHEVPSKNMPSLQIEQSFNVPPEQLKQF